MLISVYWACYFISKAMNLRSDDDFNTIEQNENVLIFSSLRTFYHPIQSRGFSIKYVTEGTERYTLDGHKYPIEAGQYLLSNSCVAGYVEIESSKQVKGICINLKPELLTEVVATQQRPDAAFSDLELGQFFGSAFFLENQYNAQQTQLGQLLRALAKAIEQPDFDKETLDMAFFYHLSEKLIADQAPVFKQLRAVPSVKTATKKALYRQVLRGQAMIDACFELPLSIEAVAQEACMSEYHFFRVFKAAFGQTPHQYLTKKRLENGLLLLQQDRNSVYDVAIQSGFFDIYSFSKAFKKHFGFAPSSVGKTSRI